MYKTYKIGFVGLGSIGTRHFINTVSLLQERGYSYKIDLMRSRKGKKLEAEITKQINNVYFSYESMPFDYDIIFITNPTHLHLETIQKLASKTNHMFIEKPLFHETTIPIHDLPLKKDMVYYVACPLRYSNVIQYVKQNVDFNKVYCARVISSSYLPDWRPHMDYRKTYSAHKDQGGGVSIDLIHEWDYLYYLLGRPEQVLNIRGKFSNLEIDSDDLSLYLAKYKNLAVEVHLDYFGRKKLREIQLFTAEDTIVGDLINSEIRYLKSNKKISFKDSRDEFQRREIAFFFDILEDKEKNHNDISIAMDVLKIAKEGTL